MMAALRLFGRWVTFETGKQGDDRDPVEDNNNDEPEDKEIEKPKQVKLGFGSD